MGAESSRLHPTVVQALRKTTEFSSSEIQDLYLQFRHDCKQPSGHKKARRTLTVEQLQHVYEETFPDSSDSSKFADHIFRMFDKDHNGNIDFAEFVTTINIQVKGSYEDKLHWVFDLYDIDGNKQVSKDELLEIISVSACPQCRPYLG